MIRLKLLLHGMRGISLLRCPFKITDQRRAEMKINSCCYPKPDRHEFIFISARCDLLFYRNALPVLPSANCSMPTTPSEFIFHLWNQRRIYVGEGGVDARKLQVKLTNPKNDYYLTQI